MQQIYKNHKGQYILQVSDLADELTSQTLGSLREWVNDHIRIHGEEAEICLTDRDGNLLEYTIERPATDAEVAQAEDEKRKQEQREVERQRAQYEALRAKFEGQS